MSVRNEIITRLEDIIREREEELAGIKHELRQLHRRMDNLLYKTPLSNADYELMKKSLPRREGEARCDIADAEDLIKRLS